MPRMPIQVLREKPTIGERWGTGLGEGLQALAEQQLQNLAERRSEARQQQKIENIRQAYGFGAPSAIEPPATGIDALGGLGAPGMQQPGIQQLGIQPEVPVAGVQQPTVPGQLPAQPVPSPALQQIGQPAPDQTRAMQDEIAAATMTPDQYMRYQEARKKESAEERKQAIKTAREKRKETIEIEREEKKQAIVDRREAHKDTAPYAKKLKTSYSAAVDSSKRLGRITELNEKGNLGVPVFNAMLKTLKKGIFGFGIDMTGLMTADAQELEKLSTDFLKNVKDIFGARITDREVALFLQTIPTLAQSKAGRRKVIRNLESFDKGMRIKKRAYDKVVKDNKGYRPIDIEMQVEEMTAPLLEQLSEDFKGRPVSDESPRGIIDHLGKGILWY